ncbi:hypothetical protein C1N51_27550 (plasmid) [Vibrio campbellii]|nr:hypothetical protein C1N51_27550 [Vibrio campbellii]
MKFFEFEDGTVVEIKTSEDVRVHVQRVDGLSYEILGFPDGIEARSFVLFGDFCEDANDFVVVRRPSYKLTWLMDSSDNQGYPI